MQFGSSSNRRCNLTNQAKHRLYCYAIYFTTILSFSPSFKGHKEGWKSSFGAWLAEVWMCVMDGNENSNHLSRNLLKGIAIVERIGRIRNYWNSKTFWKNSITDNLNNAIWYYEMTLLQYYYTSDKVTWKNVVAVWQRMLWRASSHQFLLNITSSGCQVFVCLFVLFRWQRRYI